MSSLEWEDLGGCMHASVPWEVRVLLPVVILGSCIIAAYKGIGNPVALSIVRQEGPAVGKNT